MDPYSNRNRKILSPLDKQDAEDSTADEPTNKTVTMEKEKHQETNNIDETESVKETSINDQKENPSLIEHLSDLRSQLIKSFVVFLFFFIVAFSTISFWFPYITHGHNLVILSPMEVISFYTMISALLALGLSIPFLCHFIWQFVKPALKKKEGRFFSIYSPVILLLFIGGLAFGYYIVNPLSYNFLLKLGTINFEVMISAQEYARFLLLTTMPIGLLFELPMVALFMASIGILTSSTMKKFRKYSYLVLVILSALITPPDLFSQLIILIPMVGLYEGSIFLVGKKEKSKLKKEAI